MLEVSKAVEQLTLAARVRRASLPLERVPLRAALGRILAADVVASADVPAVDNSAMDGYAFAYEDASKLGFRLPVGQRIPAGAAPESLVSGAAARIFTGAPVPDGADTVAMQEDCRREGDLVIIDRSQVRQGANIRPQGQDIAAGSRVLPAATRLRPQELGLLASLGVGEVSVQAPIRVAVFSTGDELVEPGQALGPGKLYNSNRATLQGLLTSWGADVVDLGIVADNAAATERAMREAAAVGELIVSSGGVSVGEEDHVKGVANSLGSLDFWKIAIKPGKPLAFGEILGVPFMGLPGNPASVFVTALWFLRPYLLTLQGRDPRVRSCHEISLFELPKAGRAQLLRARRVEGGVEIHPNQSSGMLSSACWGDGLVYQPVGQTIAYGQTTEFYPYRELF